MMFGSLTLLSSGSSHHISSVSAAFKYTCFKSSPQRLYHPMAEMTRTVYTTSKPMTALDVPEKSTPERWVKPLHTRHASYRLITPSGPGFCLKTKFVLSGLMFDEGSSSTKLPSPKDWESYSTALCADKTASSTLVGSPASASISPVSPIIHLRPHFLDRRRVNFHHQTCYRQNL